jgi:hypothetical protein
MTVICPLKPARWLIEIDGEFWVKFRTRPMGRWTKNQALATPVSTEEARIYMRDWGPYGAKKHRAPKS